MAAFQARMPPTPPETPTPVELSKMKAAGAKQRLPNEVDDQQNLIDAMQEVLDTALPAEQAGGTLTAPHVVRFSKEDILLLVRTAL